MLVPTFSILSSCSHIIIFSILSDTGPVGVVDSSLGPGNYRLFKTQYPYSVSVAEAGVRVGAGASGGRSGAIDSSRTGESSSSPFANTWTDETSYDSDSGS